MAHKHLTSKIIARSSLLAIILLTSFTSDNSCHGFMPTTEGKSYTYESYDKKEKLTTSSINKIVSIKSEGDKIITTMNQVIKDKKDKEIHEGEYDYVCEDGKVYIDIQSMVVLEQLQTYEGMEGMKIDMNSTDIVIPTEVKPGDQLPDASFTAKAVNNGITIATMAIDITNRKCVGEETLTTSAGTFDCKVFTSSNTSKIGFVTKEYTSKQWFVQEIGLVKSETYRNGKMMERILLTKIE